MLYNFQPLLLDGDIRRESKTEKGGIFNTRPSDKKHMSYHITSNSLRILSVWIFVIYTLVNLFIFI